VILLALNIVVLFLVFGLLDRGRVISPAYSRLDKRNLDKLRRAALDRQRFQTPDLQPLAANEGAD